MYKINKKTNFIIFFIVTFITASILYLYFITFNLAIKTLCMICFYFIKN